MTFWGAVSLACSGRFERISGGRGRDGFVCEGQVGEGQWTCSVLSRSKKRPHKGDKQRELHRDNASYSQR